MAASRSCNSHPQGGREGGQIFILTTHFLPLLYRYVHDSFYPTPALLPPGTLQLLGLHEVRKGGREGGREGGRAEVSHTIHALTHIFISGWTPPSFLFLFLFLLLPPPPPPPPPYPPDGHVASSRTHHTSRQVGAGEEEGREEKVVK